MQFNEQTFVGLLPTREWLWIKIGYLKYPTRDSKNEQKAENCRLCSVFFLFETSRATKTKRFFFEQNKNRETTRRSPSSRGFGRLRKAGFVVCALTNNFAEANENGNGSKRKPLRSRPCVVVVKPYIQKLFFG